MTTIEVSIAGLGPPVSQVRAAPPRQPARSFASELLSAQTARANGSEDSNASPQANGEQANVRPDFRERVNQLRATGYQLPVEGTVKIYAWGSISGSPEPDGSHNAITEMMEEFYAQPGVTALDVMLLNAAYTHMNHQLKEQNTSFAALVNSTNKSMLFMQLAEMAGGFETHATGKPSDIPDIAKAVVQGS